MIPTESSPDSEATAFKRNPIIERLRDTVSGVTTKFEIEPEDMDKVEVWPYRIGFLTPDLLEEAKIKLKETDENKEKAIKDLKQLIDKEKNLLVPADDNFLLMFLRARKYNVKNAFKLLQNFWSFRTEYKHIFTKPDTKLVRDMILRDYLGFLPGRDRNGSIVVILNIGKWEPEIDSVENLILCIGSLLYHAITDPATQVAGFSAIFDAREMSWKHVKVATLQNILLLIRSTQNCFPARYKTVHLITESSLFNIIWSMACPLLPHKIKKRVILHGSDVSKLRNHIHPSVLPVEYGGDADTGHFENHFWEKVINKDEPQLLELLKYGYKY